MTEYKSAPEWGIIMDGLIKPEIYRKRYVPAETVPLVDDIILKLDDKLIVTKWHTLKPRRDIASGISAYLPSKGYKVSKVFDHDGSIVYWYCDIIRTVRNPEKNKITFEDLLLDVIIYNDGHNKILDLDELLDAEKSGIITHELMREALTKLNILLTDIYSGEISHVFNIIESFEKEQS